MTVFAILSAVLFGMFEPLKLPPIGEESACYAAEAENFLLVAVSPACVESHQKREELLSSKANALAAEKGKQVVLTDDLLSFLSLKRMTERGVTDYERRALASRLLQAKESWYRSGEALFAR